METSGGCCPLCGRSYTVPMSHGIGICIPDPGKVGRVELPQLTEADVRRIIREELQRHRSTADPGQK